jgi:hypothetical protein
MSKEPTKETKEVVVDTSNYRVLTAEQLAAIINTDKSILRHIATTCFERCVYSFEREALNAAEQNCVDRCTNKFDQMVRLVAPQML